MPLPPAPPPPPPFSLGLAASAPVPPPPPPLGSACGKLQNGSKSNAGFAASDRSNLLNEIRGSGGIGGRIQLKKVTTNDRSAPAVAGNAGKKVSNGSNSLSNGSVSTSSSVSNFQEQLNAALRGSNVSKLSSSNSATPLYGSGKGISPAVAAAQDGSADVSKKADPSPRPLPPTPFSAKPTTYGAKTIAPKIATHSTESNAVVASRKQPAVLKWPPVDNLARRPSGATAASCSEPDRRLRSLTTAGDDIARQIEGAKMVEWTDNKTRVPKLSVGGKVNGAQNDAALPVAASAVRPPPPAKPPHLATTAATRPSSNNAVVPPAPPPPPSRPPSQRPPLDEVRGGGRRADFHTLRPQRAPASDFVAVAAAASSPVGLASHGRSTSDENLCQSRTHQVSTRPAPPPPPQRPPPLPPSHLRPSEAPPPPPVPKTTAIAAFGERKRPSVPILNGAIPSPPTVPDSAPPPPPPPRTDSLVSDFERRFFFRTLSLLPKADDFTHMEKQYGVSPTSGGGSGRKQAPKMPADPKRL